MRGKTGLSHSQIGSYEGDILYVKFTFPTRSRLVKSGSVENPTLTWQCGSSLYCKASRPSSPLAAPCFLCTCIGTPQSPQDRLSSTLNNEMTYFNCFVQREPTIDDEHKSDCL